MPLTARRLRLASGLILLTYITLHLTNHALGLWSLEHAERALSWSILLWQSIPGTLLLYGSAGVHFALALRTIYQRRSWQLPLTEWVRLWAGFSLPLLLIGHAVATRLQVSLYDVEPSYERIVTSLIMNGSQGWQIALLAPGWLHGCLGLWITLRRHDFVRRAKPALIGFVILVPLLSALGFAEMARSFAATHAAAIAATPEGATVAHRAVLAMWRHGLMATYAVLVLGAFAAALVRNRLERRSG